jgi:hypothetical protein
MFFSWFSLFYAWILNAGGRGLLFVGFRVITCKVLLKLEYFE